MLHHYLVRDGVETDASWAVSHCRYGILVQLCGPATSPAGCVAGYGQSRILLSPDQGMTLLVGIGSARTDVTNNPNIRDGGMRIHMLDPIEAPGIPRFRRGHFAIGYVDGKVLVEVESHERVRVRLLLTPEESRQVSDAVIEAWKAAKLASRTAAATGELSAPALIGSR